jgi:hypothetical protein
MTCYEIPWLLQGPKCRKPGAKSLYGDLVNRDVLVPAHIFGEQGVSYAARVLKPDNMHRGCMVVKVGTVKVGTGCNWLQLARLPGPCCMHQAGRHIRQARMQWLLVATMLSVNEVHVPGPAGEGHASALLLPSRGHQGMAAAGRSCSHKVGRGPSAAGGARTAHQQPHCCGCGCSSSSSNQQAS